MLHSQERMQLRLGPRQEGSRFNEQDIQRAWNARPSYATWVFNGQHDDADLVSNVNNELVTINTATPNVETTHDGWLKFIKEVEWTDLLVHMHIHIRPVDSATLTAPVAGALFLQLANKEGTVHLVQLNGISFYTASNGSNQRIGITSSCVRRLTTVPGAVTVRKPYRAGRWDARLVANKAVGGNNYYTYFPSFSISEVPPTPLITD